MVLNTNALPETMLRWGFSRGVVRHKHHLVRHRRVILRASGAVGNDIFVSVHTVLSVTLHSSRSNAGDGVFRRSMQCYPL